MDSFGSTGMEGEADGAAAAVRSQLAEAERCAERLILARWAATVPCRPLVLCPRRRQCDAARNLVVTARVLGNGRSDLGDTGSLLVRAGMAAATLPAPAASER